MIFTVMELFMTQLNTFNQYLQEIRIIPQISITEEKQLTKLAFSGDQKATHRLIEGNLRLVISVARRYLNRGMDVMDLIEEGNLGLMHAVSKFDPEFNVRFSTYSTWWIRQCIERAIMNQARNVRIPVHIIKQFHKYLREHARLCQKMQKDAKTQSMRNLENWDENKLTHFAALESFEASLEDEGIENINENFNPQEYIGERELKEFLRRKLLTLPEQQQQILFRRFGLYTGEEHSLQSIGEEIELTRERVRQIQIEGLKNLKAICRQYGVDASNITH